MKLINTLQALFAVTLLAVGATAVAQSHLPGEFIVMFHNDQDGAKWRNTVWSTWMHFLHGRTFTCSVHKRNDLGARLGCSNVA